MRYLLRAGFGAAAAFTAMGAAVAHAGGGSCNCAPPPPSSCCNVPTGHTVEVPGINVVTPTITVNTPTINVTAPTIDVQSTAVGYAQSYAGASASADASGQASGFTYANALSAANASSYFGGGGGGYSSGGGGSSYVPALTVVEGPAAQRACTEMRSIARVVAVQAVCLDDKDVPHPASQVEPDRTIGGGFEGEVYRCIAGTHMQYTLGVYAGAADFTHGQTISCLKGQALYHSASGVLACRTQIPARDCNERSLLRRFGAGIKLISMTARQCVEWSTASTGTTTSAIAFDGGVGGP